MLILQPNSHVRLMKRNIQTLLAVLFLLFHSVVVRAQQSDNVDYKPKIDGTIRGKFEYQPDDQKGRFQVRTARFSLTGKVAPRVSYKAEIDLSDKGTIRMLDAYTRLVPLDSVQLTIGQMRVPFTIDAHRSPHEQYFANRSFIAKQVGNVRDVGLTVGYNFKLGIPMRIEGGVFNGSGLTNQVDFWTRQVNFSTKLQAFIPGGWNITLSTQKINPDHLTVMMYDAGMYYHANGWHAEVEYLYKHYAKEAFDAVHSVNAFVNYDIPLKRCFFSKLSPLVRFDYMSDHSDGFRYANGVKDETGVLIVNDYKRSRLTGGVTLSIDKPFISDLRVNYEKYFYEHDNLAKVSEKDKFVIEVMTRF